MGPLRVFFFRFWVCKTTCFKEKYFLITLFLFEILGENRGAYFKTIIYDNKYNCKTILCQIFNKYAYTNTLPIILDIIYVILGRLINEN